MDLFGEPGLGDLPAGAAPIADLSRYRGMFPGLPSEQRLREQRVTHFTTEVISSAEQRFNFYSSSGQRVSQSTQRHRLMSEPKEPAKTPTRDPLPAPREGDGLLPSQAAPERSSRWLPWVLVGGGLLVAGGIVLVGARRPRRPVRANRKRRRKRRTTRRRR